MKRYEAMFLFDTSAAPEWSAVEQEVRRLMDRIGGNLLVAVKFDERKLAYEIKRRKRGTYVLTYFEADPQRIGDLERDARLSDLILRVLVLDASQVKPEKLDELKAHPADVAIAPQSGGQPGGDGPRRYGEEGGPPRGRGFRRRDEEEGMPGGIPDAIGAGGRMDEGVEV